MSSRRSRSLERGYTVAELLSVIFILALISSAAALIIGSLMRSQNQTQAKVDTVQAADMALYRIERDLRNTDAGLIWACTTGATPSCGPPSTTLAITQAIVMPTAYLNGTGHFQTTLQGKPNWQGATVYWVDAKGDIDVAFDQPPLYAQGSGLSALQAEAAVKDVSNRGMQLARFVQQLSLGVPGGINGSQVSFQMRAESTVNGALNETTYQTNVETRN